MNRLYKDMAENFPLIYASQITAYWEDYADYANGFKPVKMRNTKSRNTVKKSSKKTAAIRNKHKTEQNCDFSMPEIRQNATLILPIRWESEILAYSRTNIGEFMLEFKHDALEWRASWQDKACWDKNPFRALAKLLGSCWGTHKFSGQNISLYDLYQDIHFDFGQRANIRNRTRKISAKLPDFRLVF